MREAQAHSPLRVFFLSHQSPQPSMKAASQASTTAMKIQVQMLLPLSSLGGAPGAAPPLPHRAVLCMLPGCGAKASTCPCKVTTAPSSLASLSRDRPTSRSYLLLDPLH